MKITLIELLDRINKNEQPKKLKWDDREYEWMGNRCGYANEFNGSLMSRLAIYLTDKALAKVYFEYEEPILDDVEKKYLSEVIKPFRSRVLHIVKHGYYDNENEFLRVNLKGDDDITFPLFERGKMYRGMKLRQEYTLKDLGL